MIFRLGGQYLIVQYDMIIKKIMNNERDVMAMTLCSSSSMLNTDLRIRFVIEEAHKLRVSVIDCDDF